MKIKKNIVVVWVLSLLILSVSSCTENKNTTEDNNKVVNSQDVKVESSVLTDNKWMTLYTFKKDTDWVSNCYWECEVKWPVFYDKDLNTNGYSEIKRKDWSKQTVLNWSPLYYFFKDKKAWDINWEWVKDVWFTVKK